MPLFFYVTIGPGHDEYEIIAKESISNFHTFELSGSTIGISLNTNLKRDGPTLIIVNKGYETILFQETIFKTKSFLGYLDWDTANLFNIEQLTYKHENNRLWHKIFGNIYNHLCLTLGFTWDTNLPTVE